VAQLRSEVDEVVCLAQPEVFGAIGLFYADFHQLTDDEVVRALAQAGAAGAAGKGDAGSH
jgi:putative phosphoribosyl transferase